MTRAEGRWTSLEAHGLYEHKSAGGAVYRAVLRAEVRERLPWVSWHETTRGLFEIDGVPAGALREFSRRRVEIEERAEQLTGVTASELSRERRQGIALATRMAKTYGVDGSAGRTRLGPGPPSMASARPSSRSWSPAKPGRRCCGHHAPAPRRPRLLARTNRSSWPTGIARSAGTG